MSGAPKEPKRSIVHSVLGGDNRLFYVVVFELEGDELVSALYVHRLEHIESSACQPAFEARAWLTTMLPLADERVVFGTADGELVFAGSDAVDVVECSRRAISALVEHDGAIVATTTAGEVLAVRDGEVTPLKTAGPALFAIASIEGTLWVGGDRGLVAQRADDGWREIELGTKQTINALQATPAGVLAAGNGGVLARVDASGVSLFAGEDASFKGASTWRGEAVLAAGPQGLRRVTSSGTAPLRDGLVCTGVSANARYLVCIGDSTVDVSDDGVQWRSLAYAPPS